MTMKQMIVGLRRYINLPPLQQPGRLTPAQLTPAQRTVYDAIITHYAMVGRPPTMRQLCRATGHKSVSTIVYHVCALESLGWITRKRGRPRSIVPTVGGGGDRRVPVVLLRELLAALIAAEGTT